MTIYGEIIHGLSSEWQLIHGRIGFSYDEWFEGKD